MDRTGTGKPDFRSGGRGPERLRDLLAFRGSLIGGRVKLVADTLCLHPVGVWNMRNMVSHRAETFHGSSYARVAGGHLRFIRLLFISSVEGATERISPPIIQLQLP